MNRSPLDSACRLAIAVKSARLNFGRGLNIYSVASDQNSSSLNNYDLLRILKSSGLRVFRPAYMATFDRATGKIVLQPADQLKLVSGNFDLVFRTREIEIALAAARISWLEMQAREYNIYCDRNLKIAELEQRQQEMQLLVSSFDQVISHLKSEEGQSEMHFTQWHYSKDKKAEWSSIGSKSAKDVLHFLEATKWLKLKEYHAAKKMIERIRKVRSNSKGAAAERFILECLYPCFKDVYRKRGRGALHNNDQSLNEDAPFIKFCSTFFVTLGHQLKPSTLIRYSSPKPSGRKGKKK